LTFMLMNLDGARGSNPLPCLGTMYTVCLLHIAFEDFCAWGPNSNP
jgi:hypothetical protein